MTYTVYTQLAAGVREYKASAGDLNAAIKACELLAKTTRCPLVMVPRNPRRPEIRYQVAQTRSQNELAF